jgi:Rrf2 family protein
MQITRQAEYALRAVLYLTRLPENQKAATSQIAEKEHIPLPFLAKIIPQLSNAGVIHAFRGAQGGVALKRSPSDISMLEVVEAIDGPISLNTCTNSQGDCLYDKETNCPLHNVWNNSQSDLVERLRNTSFGKLVNTK